MNSHSLLKYFCIATLGLHLWSCNNASTSETANNPQKDIPTKPRVKAPSFNEDSSYFFVKKQVDFGPRVPNTQGHLLCGDYIISTLKGYGMNVIEQPLEMRAWDNKLLTGRNIIASFNPQATKRIIIAAHWDTRPIADQDSQNQNKPILGANDGGSGVGVILELARSIHRADKKPEVGIDFILFDLEDYGESRTNDSYCLGSQYWSKNKHKDGYSAYYGILLDMVGGKDARFGYEGFSMQYAPTIAQKVWNEAHLAGFTENFLKNNTGYVTDDHFYVNRDAGIPMIDIIQHDTNTPSNFASYWHTHKDNMDAVDKKSLKAVGQTLLEVLYNE